MRTTLSIDDGLLEDAKRRADELNVSVSALVEQGLRSLLAAEPALTARPPFRLLTFGGDGLAPGMTWARLAELSQEDEVERLLAAEP